MRCLKAASAGFSVARPSSRGSSLRSSSRMCLSCVMTRTLGPPVSEQQLATHRHRYARYGVVYAIRHHTPCRRTTHAGHVTNTCFTVCVLSSPALCPDTTRSGPSSYHPNHAQLHACGERPGPLFPQALPSESIHRCRLDACVCNRTAAPPLVPHVCKEPQPAATPPYRDMLAEGLRVKQLRVVGRPLPQLPRPLIPQPLDALLQHVLQRGVQLQ